MKKYEITDIAHPDNPNLHRIRAVTDLTEDFLAGMLGGYVESCDNLAAMQSLQIMPLQEVMPMSARTPP